MLASHPVVSSLPRHRLLPLARSLLTTKPVYQNMNKPSRLSSIAQNTKNTLPRSTPTRREISIGFKMATNSRDEDWKTEAPYLPPDSAEPDGKPFEKVIRGECHCGQVSYWLRKDKPLASKFCHCRDCQKMHGAPFQWAAIFHKEDIAFEKGVDGLQFYMSSKKLNEHDLPCKVSCGHCGSRIMDEGRNMVLLFPGLLHFHEEKKRKNFNVQMHIFYGQRVVDLPDGKPKWRELDEKSEQMEEEL